MISIVDVLLKQRTHWSAWEACGLKCGRDISGSMKICLVHDTDHFSDFITSMSALHNTTYNFYPHDYPYDPKKIHNWSDVCRLCYRFDKESVLLWRVWTSVPQCFSIHKQFTRIGTRYCVKICLHSFGVFSKLSQRVQQGPQRERNEGYCNICEAWIRQV